MTPARIEQAQQYAESERCPALARKFIRELLEEREHWKRLSESQSEALDLMEKGIL